VHTWILWEDGVEELVQAHAIAWTKRAVRVRFETPPHMPRLLPLQSSAPDAGRNVQVDSVLGQGAIECRSWQDSGAKTLDDT